MGAPFAASCSSKNGLLMHESIAFNHALDVKKTEVVDSQWFVKSFIFRIIGRERKIFSTDGLLVGAKFRIFLTKVVAAAFIYALFEVFLLCKQEPIYNNMFMREICIIWSFETPFPNLLAP